MNASKLTATRLLSSSSVSSPHTENGMCRMRINVFLKIRMHCAHFSENHNEHMIKSSIHNFPLMKTQKLLILCLRQKNRTRCTRQPLHVPHCSPGTPSAQPHQTVAWKPVQPDSVLSHTHPCSFHPPAFKPQRPVLIQCRLVLLTHGNLPC